MQNNALVKKFHSPLRFLAPKIWESFDLSEYDVVLTSSGWFICRGVKAGRRVSSYEIRVSDQSGKNLNTNNEARGTRHESRLPLQICYIHHPPRNLYGYPTGSTIQKYPLVRAYAHIINFFMRQYDYNTAQKVDYFIANSQETARRVEKFYRRDSVVIYPPVEIKSQIPNPKSQTSIKSQIQNNKNQVSKLPQNTKHYYLSVGRLSWAKRIDLTIQACNELKLPLKVVGAGKEDGELRALAGPTIEFIGGVSDAELAELYANARALIFTALEEDFGIVPVEAMMAGCPVIGLGQGGVRETVVDGKTGVLFDEPTVESLKAAIQRFEALEKKTKWEKSCVAQAQKFGKERFQKQLREFVEKNILAL